jgi:hypothetical protein
MTFPDPGRTIVGPFEYIDLLTIGFFAAFALWVVVALVMELRISFKRARARRSSTAS